MSDRSQNKSLESVISETNAFKSILEENLLRSNSSSLSEAQIVTVQQTIDHLESGNAALDAEIFALESRLSIYKKARQRRSQHLECHKRLLSATQRVPPEIWRKVFLHAADVRSIVTSFSALDPPIILTWVCRSWRDIAVSTPDLWSCIRYIMVGSPRTSLLMWLHTFMTRSLGSNLVINLVVTSGVKRDANMTEFYEMLETQCNRWREIDFSLPISHYRRCLFSAPLLCPALEKATIYGSDTRVDGSYRRWKPLLLVNSPLKHLEIGGTFTRHVSRAMLDWSQISTLIIHPGEIKVSKLFDMLNWAPKVSDLAVALPTPYREDSTLPTLTHSFLKNIEFYDGDCRALLGKLTAPELSSLKFGEFCSGSTKLEEFLERTSSLTKLEFGVDWLLDIRDPQDFKNLSQLTLHVWSYDDQTLLLNFVNQIVPENGRGVEEQRRLQSLSNLHIILPGQEKDLYSSSFCTKLCNSVASLCRQLSSEPKPYTTPALASVHLEAYVPAGSLALEMFTQLETSGLSCLTVSVIAVHYDSESTSSSESSSSN